MPFYGTQILKEFSKDFDNIIFQTFYVVWWIWNTFCTIVILNKKRRPFKAPISLRNLVRILTQNIRTQNTCYWISLCISSYYHSLQGWFCTYLMIKFIPQILRIVIIPNTDNMFVYLMQMFCFLDMFKCLDQIHTLSQPIL